MRATTAAILMVVMVMGCATGPKWQAGAMAGDNAVELRGGAGFGNLKILAAPRYEMDQASEGDLLTSARGYVIYDAIDANMVSSVLGDLPPGLVYAGLFGGADMQDGQVEGGWLVGGAIELGSTDQYLLSLCTEYQYETMSFDGDTDKYTVVLGPLLTFK